MNFKKIFCNHIWKETNRELLEEWRERSWILWKIYHSWGVTQRCIKCEKFRILEERTWEYGDRIGE
jgi:hypothetical protein